MRATAGRARVSHHKARRIAPGSADDGKRDRRSAAPVRPGGGRPFGISGRPAASLSRATPGALAGAGLRDGGRKHAPASGKVSDVSARR
ncbi:hypothetical protein GCM10023324_43280 [Streptomyces youssoufiensis]